MSKKTEKNKYEKRKDKVKKQNDLLVLKGINKFWTVHILEIIYIFLVEITTKALLGNLSFDYSLLRIFLSSCIFSLIITLITTNLPTKWRRVLLVIFNFFIVFYAWLQLGFMNFLGAFMSLGNAEQGTKITDYIVEFVCAYKPVLHLVYLPFILVILYLVFERYITRSGFNEKFEFKSLIKDIALLVYMALLCFGYYVTLEVSFMQNRLQTVSNKSLFKYPSNPSIAITNFGTSVYLILDVKGTIFGGDSGVEIKTSPNKPIEDIEEDKKRKIDDTAWQKLIEEEDNETLNKLNNYFINRNIAEYNEYTGLFEGKNLIMIMLESISEAVFHEEYKEYFPTLYKLYNEGITGVNNYSPRNNCATGESEMTSQNSLYSIGTTCTVNTYKKNTYPEALMYMLKKNGYYTSAYHDYTDQYYSRKVFEEKYGSSKFYGVKELGMSYDPAYREWPSDVVFMESAVPKFIDQDKFASYMITVTAHTPYIYSSKMGNKHLEMFEDTEFPTTVKRYLSKVKEDDLAMESLLTQLEESGKLDDTVIVIFGDHYPYGLSDKDYQVIAPWDTSIHQEVDRTPFIIYNSEATPRKIEKYTTPLDYTPTILNMLGIEYDPRLYMGHDIFSKYSDFAVFPDNSWQSSIGFYNATKGVFYPSEGSSYNDEDIIEVNNEVEAMRSMSGLAIKKNYFKYLFDYFDEYEKEKEQKEQDEKTDTKDKNEESKSSNKKEAEE